MRVLVMLLCSLSLLTAQEAVTTATAVEAAIAKVTLTKAPDNAMSVLEVRKAELKPGSRVTIRAQIGGRNPPWLPSHALMLLADAKELGACTAGGCGAPWDFCSAPPDKILQHTSLVRWLDEKGEQARAIPFTEVAKIAPLSTVVVTGVIADVGDPRALVIDMDGLFLEDRGPFAHLMDQKPKAN